MPPDPRAARASVGEIEGLRDGLWARGVARVLLAGAGGVGVPAEALAGEGPRLTVLDGTDPVQLADALAADLASTVLVVSAPPGADPAGAEIVWSLLDDAFTAEGLDPAAHTVLVAPPGHPLVARAAGAPVVPGPAHLAAPAGTPHGPRTLRSDGAGCAVGAWAALTPYALVPAGLAGADVGALLRDALTSLGAEEIADRLRGTTGHIALTGPLAECLAQLLTGPAHLRPLVVEEAGAPGWDEAVLTVGGPKADVPAEGPVAAELLCWQQAMTTIARLDDTQPPTRGSLRESGSQVRRVGGSGTSAVEVRAPWPITGLPDALARLVDGAASLAVHAHLDRHDDASGALLRTELAARTGLVTAFGWGARTAPQADAVLQLTGGGPDGPAASHQRATAEAEAAAMTARGVRVLRLHLTDRLVGLVELVRAVQELPDLE